MKDNETDDEKVLLTVRLHWGICLPAAIGFGLTLLLSLLLAATGSSMVWFFVLLAIGAGLSWAGTIFRMNNIVYKISNKRVLVESGMRTKTGILSKSTNEMLLNKIESIDVIQSILGQNLGYGRLIFKGTGGDRLSFDYVPDCYEVRQLVPI